MSSRDWFDKDYYAVLGVPKDASAGDIAKAYRKLAREFHPDVKPGDTASEARFKEASEAYAVLSNAEKRKEYDQFRDMASSGFGSFMGGGQRGGFPGGGNVNIDDLLGGLFGSGVGRDAFAGARRTRATSKRGRDVEADLTLSFSDAMAGVTTTLRVAGRRTCETCHGNGAAPGTTPQQCAACGGRGVTSSDQGMFSFSEPCRACGGRGIVIPQPCPECAGSGTQAGAREIRARIPAGVRDGARIRLAGKGEPSTTGGPPGDLYVNVHVEPHELFERRDDNLVLTVPITITEAALGARVTVPTLDEPVTVKVPAGTTSGQTFRVKARGAPKTGGGRGDLLVTVEIAVPRKLTKDQKRLLEQFAATENGAVRAHLDAALKEA